MGHTSGRGPVPLPVPSTGETAPRAAATLALQKASMFKGSAPPSPPRPPKLVPKDQPTPPKASVNDPLTPKTMELLRDNGGDQARWLVQYIWGLCARFRFALRNPMRNPLVTRQQGDRICRSHFVSHSEEWAALILDTLNPESRPLVELSSHPRRGLWNARTPVNIKGIKKKGSAPLEWHSPLHPRVREPRNAGGHKKKM